MHLVQSPARTLWQCAEPYHAVTYFAPEAHAAFEAIGLRGFWRGYFAAVTGVGRESIAPYRGWDDDDWSAAAGRLTEKGWLDATGTVTDAGIDAHAAIEADTDRMAEGPIRTLGEDALAELVAILQSMARALAAAGAIPFPNPIGVPPVDPVEA